MTRDRRFGLIAALSAWTLLMMPPTARADTTVDSMVVEDYSDIVIPNDLGFNDLSGNAGTINKDGRAYGAASLVRTPLGAPALRFIWDFTIDTDPTAFTGIFHSLFGLTRTQATFDGQTIELVHFPEHSLDLDRLDGILAEPGGPRSARRLAIAITFAGSQELKLRVELKDVDGGGRFTRFALAGSPDERVLSWDFRDPADYAVIGGDDLDLTKAKELALVIEREHVGDGVINPVRERCRSRASRSISTGPSSSRRTARSCTTCSSAAHASTSSTGPAARTGRSECPRIARRSATC